MTCSFIQFTSKAATKATAHLFRFSQGCVGRCRCSAARMLKQSNFLLKLLIRLLWRLFYCEEKSCFLPVSLCSGLGCWATIQCLTPTVFWLLWQNIWKPNSHSVRNKLISLKQIGRTQEQNMIRLCAGLEKSYKALNSVSSKKVLRGY